MKSTPFKMNGFSGFGNSPLKMRGHGGEKGHAHPTTTKADSFTRATYYEKGYTDKKKKRKKNRKAFKFTKVGKILRKVFGGGGSRGGSSTKLGCSASGSCN
jgi:hypothetical protein